MIEPLAAAVFNSFLPSRSTAGHFSSLQSAARVVSRPMRSGFPPNFFTPLPRRVKGKEKAGLVVMDECGQCTEWLMTAKDERCCTMIHSAWCTSASSHSTHCSPLILFPRAESLVHDERSYTHTAPVYSTTTTSSNSFDAAFAFVACPGKRTYSETAFVQRLRHPAVSFVFDDKPRRNCMAQVFLAYES